MPPPSLCPHPCRPPHRALIRAAPLTVPSSVPPPSPCPHPCRPPHRALVHAATPHTHPRPCCPSSHGSPTCAPTCPPTHPLGVSFTLCTHLLPFVPTSYPSYPPLTLHTCLLPLPLSAETHTLAAGKGFLTGKGKGTFFLPGGYPCQSLAIPDGLDCF